jgi:hypothetical protein
LCDSRQLRTFRTFACHHDRVTTTSPHARLITQAARSILRPAGLVQRGRSRLWLDDHGWWTITVEFQPSGFSKGSYLNVGVTWLWQTTDAPHFSFDLSGRVEEFVDYKSDDQFRSEARRLAMRALEEVKRLRLKLPDLNAAADLLEEKASRRPIGWPAWNAAVALGLGGPGERSAAMFAHVVASDDDREWWRPVMRQAATWQRLVVDDHQLFSKEVKAVVRRTRLALRLPPNHARLADV